MHKHLFKSYNIHSLKSIAKSKLLILLIPFYFVSCDNQEALNNNKHLKKNQIFLNFYESSGLTFRHFNGMDDSIYYPEIMGSAVALFDYDNDGDLDLYLGQGGNLKSKSKQYFGRLYRNDLNEGVLRFTDVTKQSKLLSYDYSMGIATGDINNDGFVDVYLSNYGDNQLFLNKGDGTFENITNTSNTQDNYFSSSSAFVDINNDDLLDLYVVNYVEFDLKLAKTCKSMTGADDFCGPNSFTALKDKLFKNLGNGKFEDISKIAGINLPGAGLGVVTADFNADGFTDIYVTNDMMHNHFWINNQDETFTNEALLRGNAVNFHGNAEASMGVDIGDVDNDGDLDLFMTHLLNETNTIYTNNGKGFFTDVTTKIGLAEPSKGHTGFGTAFLDYDNDGWLDILVTNGAVSKIESQVANGIKLPLNQPNQLFHNNHGKFNNVSSQAQVLSVENISRGLAIGDLDNDGDTDAIVSNINGFPQVLINQVGTNNNWVGIKLVDKKGRYLLGSSVSITLDDNMTIERRSHTDASFISANDPRILIGLAQHNHPVNLTVYWSNGKKSEYNNITINQYHTFVQ